MAPSACEMMNTLPVSSSSSSSIRIGYPSPRINHCRSSMMATSEEAKARSRPGRSRRSQFVGRHFVVAICGFGFLLFHQVSSFHSQAPFSYPMKRILIKESSTSLSHNSHRETDEARLEETTTDDFVAEAESDTRRRTVQALLAGTAAFSTASFTSSSAQAGVPELDPKSGQLYSPKREMLSGGTKAARGVQMQKSSQRSAQLKPGQVLQTVYETRFIAYLSRFLLNFDPAAHAWWEGQGFGETWDLDAIDETRRIDQTFAEFAESVEVGLADYFVGPYGSYSSLSAAKAGIIAAEPAKSVRPEDMTRDGFFKTVLFGKEKISQFNANENSVRLAKQGVLNLFALLKARYSSIAAKRQLAILFSFISSPRLQPTSEIRGLLGESDNATITEVTIVRPMVKQNAPKDESYSRTSPRRGGGYALDSFPVVSIDGPPALGDEYQPAKLEPIMNPTGRILRIRVADGGEGYTSAPQVTVTQSGFYRSCQATAILDRQGRVESVIVLDPGYGYESRDRNPPKVTIDSPKTKKEKGAKDGKSVRRARAVADLEYEITGISIVQPGNGYVKTEPPEVTISPPVEDPDWFLAVQEQPALRMQPVIASEPQLKAVVSEMRFSDDNVAFSLKGNPYVSAAIDDGLRGQLERDPLELLPSSIRPVLRTERFTRQDVYVIPSIARVPQMVAVLSPRFRAQDPLFGGVGKVPVTKGAISLKPDEYARLALSGAVCTVLVRTALNPLELIKTKQQLQNDKELLTFARDQVRKESNISPEPLDRLATSVGKSQVTASSNFTESQGEQTVAVVERTTTAAAATASNATKKAEKIGTLEMVKYMIALRGPRSLFQSADITLLASLVFGSFGFGATELFRRSFSSYFFSEGSDQYNEITVLMAATLATVLTAAAASPFEVLRVRSMAMLEEKPWTEVLREFMIEKSEKDVSADSFDLKHLREPRDWLPLWSGFAPILSRELPFAVVKFLTFDTIATATITFINNQIGDGALPVQIGVGPLGLGVSAGAGAIAGIAGAIVSHPADLILTKTSSANRNADGKKEKVDWRDVVKDIISQPGGLANLFVGLPTRATFFFLVIGLQFFLYDYVKNIFQVGSDDLSLVLDVFYAVRAGLITD
eukprot:scaffold1351_cov176-Amphora_coffeaeformis.AAC.6